jgi:hypothetical protein
MKLRDFAFAALAIVGIGASLPAQSDPAASPPPGFVMGIKAVGIHVRQMDRTLKFYTDGLGFVEKASANTTARARFSFRCRMPNRRPRS